MGKFYGEQYVFTDRDIHEVRVHSLKDTNIYTSLEDNTQIINYPPTSAEEVGTKYAMCHNDRIDVGVDGSWVCAKAVNSTADATINQGETVSNGFVFYHARQNGIDDNATIKITTGSTNANPTLLDYSSKFTFPECKVDKAGHITSATVRHFQMPDVVREFSETDWKTESKYKDVIKPPAMKVIGPIIKNLLEKVEGFDTDLNQKTTGLKDRVTSLETTTAGHTAAIDNLKAEVGIGSGTNKPGMEFDSNSSLHLTPIPDYATYVQPGVRATIMNYYSNTEHSTSDGVKYLQNSNFAVGARSVASGKFTSAIGDFSEASGRATAAIGSGAHAEGRGYYRTEEVQGVENRTHYICSVKTITVENNDVKFTINGTQFSEIVRDIHKGWSITEAQAATIVSNGYIGVPCSKTDYRVYPIKEINVSNQWIKFDPADPLLEEEDSKHLSPNSFKSLTNLKIFIYVGAAFGPGSHAENYATNAKGAASHAEGRFSIAAQTGAHAEGGYTQATGSYAHSEGRFTLASGEDSHAEGHKTNATGENSHAEGQTTTASGVNAHAEGVYTEATYIASGSLKPTQASHAEGAGTENHPIIASNRGSHAEGATVDNASVISSGVGSHAEGGGTNATGDYSHAEGHVTQAIHAASHAGGQGTKTSRSCQMVIGQYNNDNRSSLFIIGNGSSDGVRSNAFRVDTSGTSFQSKCNTEGADYAEYFEWADKNPRGEDRIGYFVSFDQNDTIKLGGTNDLLGVVSATASIVANSYEDSWNEKYKKDIYGRIQYEDYINAYGELSQKPIFNENYNPNLTYIPRSQRPEWAVIGMLGRLIVRDDGSCIPGKYCTSNEDGIATTSSKGYRVLKRLDESHIQILFK